MSSNVKLNIYDFDGTLYDGDSSWDFFVFASKCKKRVLWLLPKIIFSFFLYCLHVISKEKFKSICFSFLKYFENPEQLVDNFWMKHQSKLNASLKERILQDENAVIVSASPDFLLKPISEKLSVKKLIASKVDKKTGRWLDENCSGIKKINYLDKNFKNYSIHKSYADSYQDFYIAEKSEEAYMVVKGKIQNYDKEFLYFQSCKRHASLVAIFFFIFYLLLGMIVNNIYDLTGSNDYLFQADTARVYTSYTSIFGQERIVHPLLIFIQPFLLLLTGITHNSVLTVLLFQSLIGAFSIKYLYQTFCVLNKATKTNFLLLLIYGFSFSCMFFSSIFETYILSAFSLILLWYHIACDIKWQRKFCFEKYIVLGIVTTGILLTNYIIFFVGCLLFLMLKKIDIKELVFTNVMVWGLILILNIAQQCIWPQSVVNFSLVQETSSYANFTVGREDIRNLSSDVYVSGILAKNFVIQENIERLNSIPVVNFGKQISYQDICMLLFYVLLIYLIIKNMKKQLIFNLGLLLCLAAMSFLHLLYGNANCFLYSQNIIYLIFLLFATNVLKENKGIRNFFKIFLLIEIANNLYAFSSLLKLIKEHFPMRMNFNFGLEIMLFLLLIFLISFLMGSIISFLKKGLEKVNKRSFLQFGIILFVTSCFFVFYSRLNTIVSEFFSSQVLYVPIVDQELSQHFKKDIEQYSLYVEQYKSFLREKNVSLENVFNKNQFFFFGLGNRSKYVYHEGVLRKADTEEVYQRFKVKSELIIPNAYMVLIETEDGKFYKIVEDELGVHILSDKTDEILPNTGIEMSLADFKEQKYSEILKVLYQEILFNIKDGIIYPNIFVYDKAWYRDAAYGAMVLEKTHNIDLISDWILSIDEVFDKANGEEEMDNLGELLYLLSLVTDKNNSMVQKILVKVSEITKEDEFGKYIIGKTDGRLMPDYQTEWLKFGLESLGISNDYNYSQTDDYSALLWFRPIKKKTSATSFNFSYPYLSLAERHLLGDKVPIYISNQLYPLSWEQYASEANYESMSVINEYFVHKKISPTHVWMAAEFFLLLYE